jgi:hypothetical protein
MGLGLLVGAIYWLPAAVEAKYTQEFISEIFPYEESLFPIVVKSPFDSLINYVFIAQAAALLIALAILLLTRRQVDPRPDDLQVDMCRHQTFLWGVMGLFSTFMSTVLATHLTRVIPKLQATVPAWRWLAIASVFAALLVGAAVERVVESRGSAVRAGVYGIAIMLVIAANVWITVQQVIIASIGNGTLKPIDSFLQDGFTPKGSVLPQQLPDTEQATLRPPVGAIAVIKWDPLFRVVDVSTGLPVVLRLKTYQFPGWEARIDGEKADLLADSSGVQMMAIPPGRHRVEVFFANTPPRTIGALSTTAALVTISALFIYGIVFRSKKSGRGSARIKADN